MFSIFTGWGHARRSRLDARRFVALALLCGAGVGACKAELRPVVRDPAAPGTALDAGSLDVAITPPPDAAPDAPVDVHVSPPDAGCVSTLLSPLPLDLLFLVDRFSTTGQLPAVSAALVAFLRAPSTDVGAGLQMLPLHAHCDRDGDCYAGETCRVPSACDKGPLGPGLDQDEIPCGTGLDACPPLSVCRPLGRCSQTLHHCADIGLPCAGRLAENLCEPLAKTCFLNGEAAASCDIADYGKPLVPIGRLPGVDRDLAYAIDGQDTADDPSSPLGPALEGSLDYLGAHLVANPGHRAALVLISNGYVNACVATGQYGIVTLVRRAHGAVPGIDTYVIGVGDTSVGPPFPSGLVDLAAGGGTEAPFILDWRNVENGLQSILSQVQMRATTCELGIDVPVGPDSIVLRAVGGDAQDIPHVGGATDCGSSSGGWYYNAQPTPVAVLCPATCRVFRGRRSPWAELTYGCAAGSLP
jgi:hypothetical protein